MGIREVNIAVVLIALSAFSSSSSAAAVVVVTGNGISIATRGLMLRRSSWLVWKDMADLVKREVSSDQDFVNPRLFLGFDRGGSTM